MPSSLFLLDTNVLLALIRGRELGSRIDARFGLRSSPVKPLACIVSHGELWALAAVNRWNDARREEIRAMLENVVTLGISDSEVIDAYVEVYSVLRRVPSGSRTNSGENDMWIAAASRAASAILLTTDRHFDPLHPTVISREYIDPAAAR